MGADLPRGRSAALILAVAAASACSDDGAAPADAAPPPVDAAPAPRCRAAGCAWQAVPSGTTDTILTFVAGVDGRLGAATTSGGRWIAPSGGGFALQDGERPALTSYIERAGGPTLGTVAGASSVLRQDPGGVFTPLATGATVPLARVGDAFGTLVAVGAASPIQIRLWNGRPEASWSAAEVPSAAGGLFGLASAMTPATPFVTVAVGQSQNRAYILRSTNFSGVWDQVLAGGTLPPLRAVAWNRRIPGVLVAVGDGGTVLRSADGATWTPVSVATTRDLVAVAAVGGGALFVAAGKGGTVLVSATGADWTVAAAGSDDLDAVGEDDVHAYVAGAAGALFRSDAL